jgi:RNA polymerase sigma-70 factor, ECF subfamily
MLPRVKPELVQLAVDGDEHALDQILDTWLPIVVQWCTRLGGKEVDPEDAAQEVFLVALDLLPKLQEPKAFSSWLYRVTRGVLANHRRKKRRWWGRRMWDEFQENVYSTRDKELQLGGNEVDAVHTVLDRLPEDQREVLVLAAVEEYTSTEISQLLEIPVGTVKSRLRLARSRFRKEARELGLLTGHANPEVV